MTLLAIIALTTISATPNRLVALKDLPAYPPKGEVVQKVFEGVDPGISFDEVIPSWNVKNAAGAALHVEVKAYGEGFETKWYSLGKWSRDPAIAPRESVEDQKDENGDVLTDTLRLTRMGRKLDLRVTLQNYGDGNPRLSLLTLAFHNRTAEQTASPETLSEAWGKTIEVPQRAQGNYPNGGVLCSPTSLSMVLWHYSNVLKRPELNRDVPEIEAAVWDKVYDGAGNWPFNTAYAGSFDGVTSYVTRFNAIADAEKWIAAGIPVICSVSLDLLRGQSDPRPSGHLVVLVGFTSEGDPVFNDPAKKDEVRRTYKRADFEKAWLRSDRAVYLVYPEGAKLPEDSDGIWWLRG